MYLTAESPEGSGHTQRWLLIGLLVLPALIFYTLLVVFNVNLPTEDDFNGLFNFALEWHALPDLYHRLPMLLFFQHNEYRMPFLFSILGTELELTHRVSLPLWIWAGNLFAGTLLYPLWRNCLPSVTLHRRLLAFVPVAWIMMSLNYAETLNFALCGMQFVMVTALSVFAIYCISLPESWKNYVGCLLALLACGTYVNAFMIAPAGLFLLWGRGKRREFAAWFAAFALGIVPFLYRYNFGKHEHPGLAKNIVFFFTVVGGPFGVHRIYQPATFAGLLTVALFCYLAYKRTYRLSPFAFWTSVWLLLGFLLITFGRASGGPLPALVSRYKIWSDLLLASLYLQVAELYSRGYLPQVRTKVLVPAAITFSVLFGFGSDALGIYRLYWRRIDVTYAINRYLESGGKESPLRYPQFSPNFAVRPGVEEFGTEKLTGVIREGLYQLPSIDRSVVRY